MIANFNLNLDHLMKLFYTSICNYLLFAKLDSMCHTMTDDRVKRYPSSLRNTKKKNSNNISEPNKKGICFITSKRCLKTVIIQ